MKFYLCEKCGEVFFSADEAAPPVSCLGGLKELVAGTSDGAAEKHVPVAVREGNILRVRVGETLHPMTREHFIGFVAAETRSGFYMRRLRADGAPEAEFILAEGEEVVNVYAYCNLHGLWKA